MNKSIYLFELDSVYKSSHQIEMGQKRLFEETLFNGNYVVLSYNQLTDSLVFLSAIYNHRTYDKIVELFKLGVLKVSPYNDIRTPSQYVQGCIERCLSQDAEVFLFSGIPLDLSDDNKPLLKKLRDALQFSDIGILEEEIQHNKNPQNIEFLVRYIKMILVLSVENLAKSKSNKNSFLSFSEIIGTVIDKYQAKERVLGGYQESDKDNKQSQEQENKKEQESFVLMDESIFYDAIEFLAFIKEYLIQHHPIGINNRSNWIAVYSNGMDVHQVDTKTWGMCEIIINLCYNYTVEQSIDGIYVFYDKFGDEKFFANFEHRLSQNWKDFSLGHYVCYQPVHQAKWHHLHVALPRWSTAQRILSKVQHYRVPKGKSKLTERQLWNRTLVRYFLTAILTTMAYIGVFILAEHLVDFTKEFLSKYFEVIFDMMSDMKTFSTIINAIFTTILFGIFGSLIAKIFKMPDILEGVRDIFVTFHDLKIVVDYYFNHKI